MVKKLLASSGDDLYKRDAAGNLRLIDITNVPNTGSGPYPYLDIGAIEFQDVVPPCFADTNNDGSLTPADFTAWVDLFNSGNVGADVNKDGSNTPTDFTAWINSYNMGC